MIERLLRLRLRLLRRCVNCGRGIRRACVEDGTGTMRGEFVHHDDTVRCRADGGFGFAERA